MTSAWAVLMLLSFVLSNALNAAPVSNEKTRTSAALDKSKPAQADNSQLTPEEEKEAQHSPTGEGSEQEPGAELLGDDLGSGIVAPVSSEPLENAHSQEPEPHPETSEGGHEPESDDHHEEGEATEGNEEGHADSHESESHGQHSGCQDKWDSCPIWDEYHQFCDSKFYTEGDKEEHCAHTCGFC
ncbi:shK domain-like domain-containing protein [Ditylenchus destructor]|uniref:ShK domain-like domain-containing protein n=1 Tax=Ditylenchus destructor TaxID=166010 RepID=A0AAD4N386_9BILA|nr:shK domain-like domain-containing protein [Ditylenchus destructor]